MPQPPAHAERYTASASWCRHPPPLAKCRAVSRGFLQRGGPAHRRGELAHDLRSGLRRIAGRKAVEHLAEVLLGQILVSIAPDQHHGCIDAGAKTLDFLPAEVPVAREMKGIVMDAALAYLDDVRGAAQPAGRGAADLDVGLAADRLPRKHGEEGGDPRPRDGGLAEKMGARGDRASQTPAVMLSLAPPQDRDD